MNFKYQTRNQILSNILDQSKNTAHISFGGSQSKLEKISWFIDRRSWFIERSWFT